MLKITPETARTPDHRAALDSIRAMGAQEVERNPPPAFVRRDPR